MTQKDILNIIAEGENERVEFKTSFNKEVIETLVAFANTKGGAVYIGVSDKGKITGVNINNESLKNWVNEVKNKTYPIIIPDINTYIIENKNVIELNIDTYPLKPVATQGRYFKRVGNSNHLLSATEVSEMHLKTINSSWDAYPDPLHTMGDISNEKVQNVINQLKIKGKTVDNNIETFLSKSNLLRENKLTFAAYLLFKKSDCFLSTIELGRFQDDITIKDSDRTKSDLINQVEDVFNFVKKHINKAIIITGQPQNTEKWDYPLEAIREIIMNMIVHRNYRSSSDSIVKVYNDKIEFYNPGRLPDDITVEDLLNNTYNSNPRNKLIADLFKDLGHIEKYGSGIKRVINLFKKENLPIPEFENISGGFMVTVFAKSNKDTLNDTLNNRHKILLKMIKDNKYVKQEEMAEKCTISIETIKRDIKKMQKNKLIQRIGSKKSGYWKIINNI